MRLETKRLIIREWKKNDLRDLILNLNNRNICKWLFVVHFPYTKKYAEKDIYNSIKKGREKEREDYNLAIELKKEKKVIGEIELIKAKKFSGRAEIDYWIGERYWNRGYVTEALRGIINFAFGKLRLKRIKARIFKGNIPSMKILRKSGFEREVKKTKMRKCKSDGKIKTEWTYILINKS